jgi:ankyrin repeat protein
MCFCRPLPTQKFFESNVHYWADHVNSLTRLGQQLVIESRYGNLPQVESLINQIVFESREGHIVQLEEMINLIDSQSWTPLSWAAHHGHTDIARLLLDYGANVNHQTTDGLTPLSLASQKGHWETAQLLLGRGGIVCQKDPVANIAIEME